MKISKGPDNKQLQACHVENVIPSDVGKVGLVKLLHFTPVTQFTIEPLNGDIFNYKHLIIQNNHNINTDQSL